MILYRFLGDLLICVNSQNKLQNLAGQRSDVLENLTPIVRKRVDALRDIQVLEISFVFAFNGVFFCFVRGFSPCLSEYKVSK